MPTETIINWLREQAKGADWSWRRVMLAAADRLDQLNKSECGRDCKNCWKTKLVNPVQKWIPASQPPKKYGKYLVACENAETAQIRLYEGEWDSIAKVTHWMPLPRPPKGE